MEGEKLGYIPMKRNEVLFHLMNAGKKLFGVIVGGKIGELTETDGTWVPIYICELFGKVTLAEQRLH